MSVDTWRDYLVRRGLVVGLAGSSGVEFICGARLMNLFPEESVRGD